MKWDDANADVYSYETRLYIKMNTGSDHSLVRSVLLSGVETHLYDDILNKIRVEVYSKDIAQ